MKTPLISVIIPAYNAEKTIARTIKSVLAQTYSNFELLIIDDGSQDATVEIAKNISDTRLKLFSYPHQGHSAGRNRGLTHAVGEFVSFIDADDMWTPDKLEAQLQALQSHPEAAVAYSWTNFIDQDDRFLRAGSYIKAKGNVYSRLLGTNFIENGSNPLIRRDALTAVGKFDETLITSPDWDMWLRLAARYGFVCVEAPQILYRVSTHSVSSNVRGMEKSCLRILNRNFAEAPVEIQPLKGTCFSNFYLYLTLRNLEVSQSRWRSLASLRYLAEAVKYDRSLPRRRTYLTFLALAKIGFSVVLSPQGARQRLAALKSRH
jgi:glycosyltransferase involved in cell wall biosynthesis